MPDTKEHGDDRKRAYGRGTNDKQSSAAPMAPGARHTAPQSGNSFIHTAVSGTVAPRLTWISCEGPKTNREVAG